MYQLQEIEDPITMGELCEAIMSGRVQANVRDGHYEVKAVEVRGMRRSADALLRSLEHLRPQLPLDPGSFDQAGPCGEDVS